MGGKIEFDGLFLCLISGLNDTWAEYLIHEPYNGDKCVKWIRSVGIKIYFVYCLKKIEKKNVKSCLKMHLEVKNSWAMKIRDAGVYAEKNRIKKWNEMVYFCARFLDIWEKQFWLYLSLNLLMPINAWKNKKYRYYSILSITLEKKKNFKQPSKNASRE